jgi:hypothetical protein
MVAAAIPKGKVPLAVERRLAAARLTSPGMILSGTANATILATGLGSVGVGSKCNVTNVGTKEV